MDREWMVVLAYRVGSEYCTNSWYYREIAKTNALWPALELATAVENGPVEAIRQAVSSNVTIDTVYVRETTGGGAVPSMHLINKTGANFFDAVPAVATVVVTWYGFNVPFTGRTRRRSSAFSGCPENYQGEGSLNSAGQEAWDGVAFYLNQTLKGPGTNSGHYEPIFKGSDSQLERTVQEIVARSNLGSRKTRRRKPGHS